MNNRWWTDKELSYLEANLGKTSKEHLASVLKRKVRAVNSKISKMGKARKVHKAWTTEEENWLKKNYLTSDVAPMVQHLGRTYVAIRHKAMKLKLERENTWPAKKQ